MFFFKPLGVLDFEDVIRDLGDISRDLGDLMRDVGPACFSRGKNGFRCPTEHLNIPEPRS